MLKRAFALTLCFIAIGCSKKSSSSSDESDPPNKFYVKVLSQTTALADGFTDLLVHILVSNGEGAPVPQHKVLVEIYKNGSGLNLLTCSTTDSEGKSLCRFRSTIGGLKEVGLDTLPVILSFNDVLFNRGSLFSVVASGQTNAAAGTDLVNSSIGAVHDTPRQESSGWLLRTDPSIVY